MRRFAFAGVTIVVALMVAACVGSDNESPAPISQSPDASTGQGLDSSTGTDSAPSIVDAAAIDGGPTTFCSTSKATFCADFDTGSLMSLGGTVRAESGTVEISGDNYISSPRSLKLHIDAVERAKGRIELTPIPTSLRRAKVTFRWRRTAFLASDGRQYEWFQVVENGDATFSFYWANSLGWYANVAPKTSPGLPSVATTGAKTFTGPKEDQWHTIEIDITFAAAPMGGYKVLIDGVEVVSDPNVRTSVASETKSIGLRLGAVSIGANIANPVDQFIDDVEITPL